MFQIQFSNSGFGSSYPRLSFGNNITDELRDAVTKYPKIYEFYSNKL